MPKTSNKTPKKNQSKFVAWLNSSSPNNRVALFIILFAAIAGGVMLYNSFAAASPRIHYTDKIKGSGGSLKVVDNYASYASYASSGNAADEVWDLPVLNSSVTTNFNILKHKTEVDYSTCLLVKRPLSANQAAIVEIAVSRNDNSGGVSNVKVMPSDKYQTVCDSGMIPFVGGDKGKFSVKATNQTGGDIYIQAIMLNSQFVSYTSL
ncbi:MAG: hypothetical protein ACXWLH_06080 [Candidatus Saccharimonadales bacterium]